MCNSTSGSLYINTGTTDTALGTTTSTNIGAMSAPGSILLNTGINLIYNNGISSSITPTHKFHVTPQNTMTQTKVAVFKIKRDLEKNTITKSTFMEEFWVERVSGVSLELLAAKDIKGFDPLTMVIKETYSVSF